MASRNCEQALSQGARTQPPRQGCGESGRSRKKRLTGERLAWYRVASHLRLPVRVAKSQLTFSEFLEWFGFLQLEEHKRTKQDFYLAQIAAEVRRGQVKHPRQVKLTDFLMKEADPARETKAIQSKQIWATAVGVKLKKN